MSNVQISALPSTTSTTLNDWVIKNDSGETLTSKVKIKDSCGLTSMNGNNSIQSAKWLTSLGTTASTESSIAIGNGAEATSPYSIAIGYEALNFNRDGGRDYYTCIGYRTRAVQGGTALGKEASALGANSTAIGQSSQSFGNGGFAVGNNALNQGTNGVALGEGAQDQSNLGGIAIGYQSRVISGDYGIAIGYESDAVGQEAIAIGWDANSYGNSSVGVGSQNTIRSGVTNGFAFGRGNDISGCTEAGAIGISNDVNHDKAVVIGHTLTSLYEDTTHVQNIHTFKTKSFDVINGGSVGGGVVNVDLSLGTLFIFTMTGNTSPNFINWREGQQIQFWVVNTSNYSVPAATISGGGDVYAKGGSIAPTNNATSGYYGTIINGDLYLDEHLNFQVV